MFFLLSDAVYANYAHLMRISKYRRMAIPNLHGLQPLDPLLEALQVSSLDLCYLLAGPKISVTNRQPQTTL